MNENFKFGFVALMGPPNAGKSTLMNSYLGQKVAIVSPKPQTTRNRITGILTTDEAQIVFLDTPGVHGLRGVMNKFLLDSAFTSLTSANVAVLIVDAAFLAGKPDKAFKELKPLMDPINQAHRPTFIAANKMDKVKDKRELLPVIQRLSETFPDAEIVPLSAKNDDNTKVLLDKITGSLPVSPPMFPEDQVSTVPMRFMASEIVREKLFYELRQELPYSTAVEIEHWEEETEKNLVHIHAVIYTSRPNHKGIIIGKQGATLKKVGSESRVELEEMLEAKVNLKLWVKVREGWTEDPGFLRSIGLSE